MSEVERQRTDEAAAVVRQRTELVPRVALVLGSGLSDLADEMTDAVVFEPEELPHLPRSTVEAHDGRLVLGRLGGVPSFVLRGRQHIYEGYSATEVVRPVRLARALGATVLVLTNAAGGIREDLAPGTLMLLEDHVNLTGQNPLTGPNSDALGPRFPDMSAPYDADLRARSHEAAAAEGFALAEGVYAAMPGPSYETRAEIRMLAALGVDAVGMSTVHEAVAAVHGGVRVLAFSSITNRAAGLSDSPLSHEEVVETNRVTADRNRALLRRLMPLLDPGEG